MRVVGRGAEGGKLNYDNDCKLRGRRRERREEKRGG